MKSRLLWLGVAAFMLAIIALLPVRWLTPLLPQQLQCRQWRGSLWHGQCQNLVLQQHGQPALQAELLRWNVQPAALLRLTLRASFTVRTAQGTGTGVVELGRGGRMAVENLQVSAVFDRRLAAMLPAGWKGELTAKKLHLELRNERLAALSGEITLQTLTDAHGQSFGSYQLRFPSVGPPFIGQLHDDGGPLAITATLTVMPELRWQLMGTITPEPGAPESLRRQLEYLGAPDTAGRYPLSLEGLFK